MNWLSLELSRLDEQNGCRQLQCQLAPEFCKMTNLHGKVTAEEVGEASVGWDRRELCDSHPGMFPRGKCTLSEKVQPKHLCSEGLGPFGEMVGTPTDWWW